MQEDSGRDMTVAKHMPGECLPAIKKIASLIFAIMSQIYSDGILDC